MTTDPTYGTRAEHLDFCKKRALQYVDMGDLDQAMASMGSDLNKHPDTAGHPGMQTWLIERMTGGLTTPDQVRRYIEGFH